MNKDDREREEWILVTGGAGFIGSHTVDALLTRGENVIVLDNFSTGTMQNLESWIGHNRLRVIAADVCDGVLLPVRYTFGGDVPVKSIIHLAAQTSVIQSIISPLHDIRSNYVGTVHVLDFARACDAKSVIFASSAAVYAENGTFPRAEDSEKQPLSTYAINKLAGEYLLQIYCRTYGLRGTILRFFNVYGPRQGECSQYSGVISTFCRRAMLRQPLIVHGDGLQTRDFVFVTDVVSAICAASDNPEAHGRVINIGSGEETTVLELAHLVIRVVGGRSEVRFEPVRLGSVRRSRAAIDRAIDLLGFKPSVDLEAGLRMTWSAAQQQQQQAA